MLKIGLDTISAKSEGNHMSSSKTEISNPLDAIPNEIPYDVPYGPPISLDQAQAVIQAAVADAKKRNWKMNAAVVDSGGNLVAFQRMDGAGLPPFTFPSTRHEQLRPSVAKPTNRRRGTSDPNLEKARGYAICKLSRTVTPRWRSSGHQN